MQKRKSSYPKALKYEHHVSSGAREHLYQAVVALEEALKVKWMPKRLLSKLRRAQQYTAKAGMIVDDILHGK